MFYGDGMITPAITVLGAVEGLGVIAPALHPFIVPIAVVILVALFAIQRHGTARLGAVFGPVMGVWFVVLGRARRARDRAGPAGARRVRSGVRGALHHRRTPASRSSRFGAVVLAVTGAEALYADMGHFGKTPIRRAWLFFVMPALLLNYFGQGALILHDPAAIQNPFYLLAPDWARVPLLVLATCGGDHRVAGGHLRRVLADARGDPDGLLPAAARSCTRPSARSGRSTCRSSTGCC